MVNLVTDKVVKNGAGTQVAETKTTYDSTALTSVAGITHHDDANYGTGNTVRGNPTLAQRWVSGSTYLSTTSYYDTTGQLTQVTDPLANNTTFSYSDNFFTDSSTGTNPPSPYTGTHTNAYLTLVTLPISGTKSYGYYFSDGKLAVSTDQNGQASYQHYESALDRLAYSAFPDGGWTSRTYRNYGPIMGDVYTALYGTAYTCGACRHDQLWVDSLARPYQAVLPDGPMNVTAAYDPSGRLQSITNPYNTTNDPTYGYDLYIYDRYGRVTQAYRPDSSMKSFNYGGGPQSCSPGTYGLGYATAVTDEAGRTRQTWADGFGRTIEADEPDSNGNLTVNTCYKYDALNNLIQVVQGSQTRTYSYDGLSRLTASTTPE
jgi:YD repeat-containing protein